MDYYLIESPHDLENCAQMLQQITAMGYLHHFDWGCKAGIHCGWAIIEAENEAQARLAVPPLVRQKAHIIQLNKFSPEEVDLLHAE